MQYHVRETKPGSCYKLKFTGAETTPNLEVKETTWVFKQQVSGIYLYEILGLIIFKRKGRLRTNSKVFRCPPSKRNDETKRKILHRGCYCSVYCWKLAPRHQYLPMGRQLEELLDLGNFSTRSRKGTSCAINYAWGVNHPTKLDAFT